jgi:hypothetical protein
LNTLHANVKITITVVHFRFQWIRHVLYEPEVNSVPVLKHNVIKVCGGGAKAHTFMMSELHGSEGLALAIRPEISRNCAQSKNIFMRDMQMQGNYRKMCKRKSQVTNMKGRVVQVRKTSNKIEDRIWQKQ